MDSVSDGASQADRADGQLVRTRLRIMAIAIFAITAGATAAVGLGFGGTTRVLGVLPALVVVAVVVPICIGLAVRSVLGSLEAIESDRERLAGMYGQARLDALVDGLTGLGNHRAFQEELGRQLSVAQRYGRPLALLLLDVDDLKSVNDREGHPAGDDLLVSVGRIANSALRRGDRAFRTGGDEFAILLPQTDPDTGAMVARRILATALDGSVGANGTRPFSVSIGVSAYPAPSTIASSLYAEADAALYSCKRHGRTAVEVFDPDVHALGADGRSIPALATAVMDLVDNRAIKAAYQPVFDLQSGDIIGFEGLIRPTDAGSFPDASSLFSAAEAVDRTVELDMVALETVAAGARGLSTGAYLAVNISPRTLESESFSPGELVGIFQASGIPADRLVIELTERQAVEAVERLRSNLETCRRLGIRIAADDIGSGNAGLRLLSEVHFDIVKIDLALVQGGISRDPSRAVLRALQDLASRWKATIVAEGVETVEQLHAVRELGMRAAQGYLLGRPGPIEMAEAVDIPGLLSAADSEPGGLFVRLAARA